MSWRERYAVHVEALQELSDRDLQSLLLEVFQQRASKVGPQRLLARYRESRFVQPSPLDLPTHARLLALAWELLPEPFQALELSPLAPLGGCSSLASVSQNKVVSTARNCEVSADPSPTLALECALRRKSGPVHLATWQRVVRAQSLPDAPGYFAHFGILALASSDRWGFESEALSQHWGFYREFLKRAVPGARLEFRLTDWSGLAGRLRSEFSLDSERTSGRGYYQRACFKIYVNDVEVGDGGFTDWTGQLLSDHREGLLSSGLGWERLVALAQAAS
ncbi:MAG: hypothetical protein U0931_19065 [Vulcanimicrobiota bacterium]